MGIVPFSFYALCAGGGRILLQVTVSAETSTSDGCLKCTFGKRPPATSERGILSCIRYKSVWDVNDCTKTCQASEGREKVVRWHSILTREMQNTQVIVHSLTCEQVWQLLGSLRE